MMNQYKILVVDDEVDQCEILKFNLECDGYEVQIAHSAEEALKKEIHSFDLLLLDVMLGEVSGFRMAHMLRENPQTRNVFIIFLTARDSINDRLTGFALGAEDYILKPFSVREVSARIKAVLRRISDCRVDMESSCTSIKFNTLEIFVEEMKVMIDNKEIPFTKREFEILQLLLENRNRVFSREEIRARIWSNEKNVINRTVDVNITRLRNKIGPYEKNLVTRLGYGYSFEG